MDPNTNLRRQRELVAEVLADEGENKHAARELAEHVEALDEWITNGGFLPEGWAR